MKKYAQFIKESLFDDIKKDFCVWVNSKEEYNRLMEFLESNGFHWHSGRKPTQSDFYEKDQVIYCRYFDSRILSGHKLLSHSTMSYYKSKNKDIPLYSVDEVVNKKYKKIERPDLDPYGEEDWGYEEITENKEVWIKKDHFETGDIVEDTRHLYFGKGIVIDTSRPDYIIIEYENRTGYSEKNCEKGKGWSTGCEYVKYFRFLVHNKRRIERPDLDPYGEEDWGWEEIKENESNKKYYLCINDTSEIGHKMNITYHRIYRGIEIDPTIIKVEDDIGRVTYYNTKYFKKIPSIDVNDIEKQFEEEDKRKEKSRLKHIDVDPYGEEEWEN